MNHIRAFLTAVALFGAGSAHPVEAPMSARPLALPEAARRTYAQNYADIALALCIGQAYASEPHAREDALSSAAGIDAWSNFELEDAHDAMSALIARYLARDYASIHGREIRLDLMKCIDMYHGKELAAQVRRFAPMPNRTYEGDNPTAKP